MKTIKIFALTAVMLTVALVSCSKDETFSSPSSNVSVIKIDDGVMTVLKSIKDGSDDWLNFNYDGEGRCTAMYDNNYPMLISYDPFECAYYYDCSVDMMSFNSSGYLSKMIFSDEYSGTDYSYSCKWTYTFSYDGSHLTKVSDSVSETGTEDGKKYKYSYDTSTVLTWTNGNVKKVTYSEKGADDDGKWTYNDTHTFEYGDTGNDYSQITLAFMNHLDVPFPFGFIGYFGKGTTLLPKSCEYEYEDYDEYNGKEYNEKGGWTYSYSYTKDSSGLIKTEKETEEDYYPDTYTYSYDHISLETRSMVTLPEYGSPTRENAEPHRRMFDSRGQHHSPHHNNVHSHEK